MRGMFVLVLMLDVAARALACTPASSEELIPMPIVSANGRYAVVLRYENEQATATLFEQAGDVAIALTEIPVNLWRDEVLVSNAGSVVLARQFTGPCSWGVGPSERIISVYSQTGEFRGSVTAGELVTEHDRFELARRGVTFTLHGEEERETVTISIPVPPRNGQPAFAEFHVDAASGALLDTKRELYPSPHVDIAPAASVWRPEYEAPPAGCAAAFARADVQHLDAVAFVARATAKPLPSFPVVMGLAKVRGTVIVEAVVSEKGDVLCTRHTSLPFGGGAAAGDAIRRWTFAPLEIDGHAVPFAGEVAVQFDGRYDTPPNP